MGFATRRFRPGENANLHGLGPEKLTVFIEIDRMLLRASSSKAPKLLPQAVLSMKRKQGGMDQRIKGKPYSHHSYERLPSIYETPLELGGLPFPHERLICREKPLFVYMRKHARSFLRDLRDSGRFHVVAFTRMMKERADALIDCLEGRGPESTGEKLFDARLYQEHCCWVPTQPEESARSLLQPDVVTALAADEKRVFYVKSLLTAVPSIDLKRCVLVDFDGASCAANLANSLCFEPYYGQNDEVLPNLLQDLLEYSTFSDIRDILKRSTLSRAYTTYRYKKRHTLPGLQKEVDGLPWLLEQPVSFEEPEIVSKPSASRRRICFGGVTYQGKLTGTLLAELLL